VDVVVVGAGLAGLRAASILADHSINVVVLEARDRVGGRTCSVEVDGKDWDVGGQWIGATHHRVRELISSLGLQLSPQYDEGKHILVVNNNKSIYEGNISSLNISGLGTLAQTVAELDHLCLQVPLDEPFRASRAADWDSFTVETWQRERLKDAPSAIELMNFIVRTVFAVEPSQISFLFFLFMLRSGGGYNNLADIRGGAQQDKVIGGTQNISKQLALKLSGDSRVILNSPVFEIQQNETGVKIFSRSGTYQAKFVIVAIPPLLAGSIVYSPPMPPIRDQLTQRMPQGCIIKVIVIYEKPFWREQGYSGEVLTTEGPLTLIYDATSIPTQSNPTQTPAFVGFICGLNALNWAKHPDDVIEKAIISQLVSLFGVVASHPYRVVIKNWMLEPWSRGCYLSVLSPGVLTTCGEGLRKPVGRIHWAGSETAMESMGYMDGAVSSGERAADEVLSKLKKLSKL